MNKKPAIYAYNDFRLFLRDIYHFRHQQDKSFSKSFVCKALGLPNSRSYFQDILNGKYLSQLKVPLFIEIFDLNKDEARFFRALIDYNQAVDDQEEREYLFEQLITLNRTPKKIIESEMYVYYRSWYNSVVRTVLNIIDFRRIDNYRTLANNIIPPITEAQAKSSVKLLCDLGLIFENEKGFLKPTEKVISTGAFADNEVIRQYQLKSLSIAQEALLRNRKHPQRVITKMISVSEEGLKRVMKNIEKCSAEITSIVHKDEEKADRIYQLDIVLFPHMKKDNK